MHEQYTAGLKQRLHAGFSQAGLLPEAGSFRWMQRQAFAAGEDLLSEVAAVIGRAPLLIGLNACRFPGWASDGTSLAGWGYQISNFALWPIVESSDARDRLAKLGGLAHLIFALYDHVVDHLSPGTVNLSAKELRDWMNAGTLRIEKTTRLRKPVDHLVKQLVKVYLVWLQDVPEFAQHPEVVNFVQQIAARLFAAAPSGGISPGVRLDLITRDVFPFLVIGTPGWAFIPSPPVRRVHFLFLYRYGRFIGLLDDAFDLREDARAGRPNLWQETFSTAHPDADGNGEVLIRRLTNRGLGVIGTWSALAAGADPQQQEEQLSIFRHSLLAWFDPHTERYNLT